MARIGQIEQLTLDNKLMRQWFSRFDLFVTRNQLFVQVPALQEDNANAEARSAAIRSNACTFLTYCNADVYGLLCSLTNPREPADQSYKELQRTLCDHLAPRPTKTLKRYLFCKTVQSDGESVSQFVTTLRHTATECQFTAEEYTSRLCDQFVVGVNCKEVMEKLLLEQDLTLENAVRIATNAEKAAKEASSMMQRTAPVVAHAVTSRNRKSGKQASSSSSVAGPSNVQVKSSKVPIVCNRCKLPGHKANKCSTRCFKCSQVGHISKYCRVKSTNQVTDDVDFDQFDLSLVNMLESQSEFPKHMVKVQLEGRYSLDMEFDSGSTVSVVSSGKLRECVRGEVNLQETTKSLRVANGAEKKILGKWTVDATFNHKTVQGLELFVVEGSFPSLMGRSWINEFLGKDWLQKTLRSSCDANHVKQVNRDVAEYVDQLKENQIFQPGLGLVQDFQAKLTLKDGAKAVFLKARPLPYALKDRVGEELDSMEEQGILQKVESSEWGTPIVAVQRGNKVRICGDYKSTLNKALESQIYPLPTTEDCFNKMTGGTKFSVIDIKSAYNNLMIRESDRKLTVINSHQGLYQWNRLPFGICSSAAIFQERMDRTLQGLDMVTCRIDDILISGKTDEEHLANLREVVRRLETRGFKCNLEKSKFFQNEVVYLGHVISADGLRPVKSKVEDLVKAPAPENVEQLISFLGAVNYYRKYLPNLSSEIEPLERLRVEEWKWGKREQQAFKRLKDMLCSEQVLVLYDPKKQLKLDTDASSRGLGAVLSHVDENGERPIEFISRTLSKAERQYSQIDREALAIHWAINKFHVYLYGNHFQLVTDHKPLVYIFDKNKKIPEMSNNRISRYAVTLMMYSYDIVHRKTKDHANCDMLSRLPIERKPEEEDNGAETVLAVNLEEAMISSETVTRETRKDPVLSKVFQYTVDGWPKKVDSNSDEMKQYERRQDELSIEHGCLTWGNRVIIPTKLRKSVLEMLHISHPGMSSMKMLARSYIWWPNLNSDIETVVKTCTECSKFGKSVPKVPEHPWCRAKGPWQRIHMDFCGPFMSSMWLVIQDSYSKWPEIIKMSSTTTAAVIKVLREVFSRTGIPFVIVSDNGPQFISEELQAFMKSNRINHILTPTYHPKSNGLAERLVGSFKSAMKKMESASKDVEKNKCNFLLNYRNTPHSTTGETPAIKMYGRSLRSRLHQIKPTDAQKREDLQTEKEKLQFEKPTREFQDNQPVYVQVSDKTWKPAKILNRVNGNVYDIEHEGRQIRKHVDHVKERRQPVINLEPTLGTHHRGKISENPGNSEQCVMPSVFSRVSEPPVASSSSSPEPSTAVSETSEPATENDRDQVRTGNLEPPAVRGNRDQTGLVDREPVRRSNRRIKPRQRLDL